MNTIHVDVVSAEESIWSGEARFVALPGESGELGIYPRHTPLITRIKAGSVRIEKRQAARQTRLPVFIVMLARPRLARHTQLMSCF